MFDHFTVRCTLKTDSECVWGHIHYCVCIPSYNSCARALQLCVWFPGRQHSVGVKLLTVNAFVARKDIVSRGTLSAPVCMCVAVRSQVCKRTGYQSCSLIICSAAYHQQIRE